MPKTTGTLASMSVIAFVMTWPALADVGQAPIGTVSLGQLVVAAPSPIPSLEVDSDERRQESTLNVALSQEHSVTSGDNRILLAVEFYADSPDRRHRNRTRRYMWVDSTANLPSAGAQALSDMSIDFIPITDLTNDNRGRNEIERGVRHFPVEIRRQVGDGTRGVVTIYAVGYSVEAEHHLDAQDRLSVFANIAVNTLGLRYMNLEGQRNIFGAELVRIDPEFGLRWNLNDEISVEVTLVGVTDRLGYAGSEFSNARFVNEYEIYHRLEIFLKRVHHTYSLFFETGENSYFGQGHESTVSAGIRIRF